MMASTKKIFFYSSITLLVLTNFFISNALPLSTSEGAVTCPASKTARYVYHNDTQKCYKEKTSGPCPENMVIYRVDKDMIYGECDCTDKGFVPWVYHAESDKCYKTYQQSYCSSGEWLIFDQDLTPVCKPNPCLNELSAEDEDTPTVLYKDHCVKVNKNSETCANPQSEIIKFLPESVCQKTKMCTSEVIPICVSDTLEQSLGKTNQLRCKPGTRRDIKGNCRRTVISESSSNQDEAPMVELTVINTY